MVHEIRYDFEREKNNNINLKLQNLPQTKAGLRLEHHLLKSGDKKKNIHKGLQEWPFQHPHILLVFSCDGGAAGMEIWFCLWSRKNISNI